MAILFLQPVGRKLQIVLLRCCARSLSHIVQCVIPSSSCRNMSPTLSQAGVHDLLVSLERPAAELLYDWLLGGVSCRADRSPSLTPQPHLLISLNCPLSLANPHHQEACCHFQASIPAPVLCQVRLLTPFGKLILSSLGVS